MNFKYLLLVAVAFLSFSSMAQNDDLTLTIQNQQQDGNQFSFDIYANTTSGTTYLGDGDIVLETAAAKWSSLAVTESNINSGISALSSTVISGEIVVNLQGNFSATVPSDFLEVTTTPIRLVTITVTTVDDFTATPDFAFVTTSNLKTELYEAYTSGSRLRQRKISSPTLTEPAAGVAPVAGPASFAVDMSTPGQADLTWGSVSDSVLVVAREGSANATAPVNTVTYTGNTVFASGDSINEGASVEYVVGKLAGSTTSLSVTGLDAGSTYHFAIYNFTGGSGRTEAYGPASVATGVTLFAEPTAAGTSLVFSNVNETTFDIGWTSGDGTNVIVVLREAATAAVAPTDASSYSANSTFTAADGDNTGTGNVVMYSGSNTTSLSISGLTAATEYAVDIYEYNGTGAASNYFSTPLSGNQFSRYTEPNTVATTLTFANVAETSFDANWTSGNGDSVLVVARLTSTAAVAPVDGTEYNANSTFTAADGDNTGTGNIVMYRGPQTATYSLSGLTAGTDYTLDIYEYNGASNYTNYNTTALSGAQTTQYTAPTTPGTGLLFSNVAETSFDIDWTSGNGDSVLIVVREAATAAVAPTSGTGYAANSSYSAADGDNTGTGNVVMYIGAQTTTFSVTGLTAGTEYSVDIYEYNGAGVTTNFNTTALSGDQFSMFAEPTTAGNTLTFSSVAPTSFTANWTSGNGDSVLVVARLTATAAVVPVDGTGYAANSSFTAGDGDNTGTGNVVIYAGTQVNTVDITGLTAGIDYTIDIYEYNGDSEYSNYNTTALSGAQTTQFNAPATPGTNLVFSNLHQTFFDIDWTSGNGTNVIVVVREASTAAVAPTTGTGYSANTSFTAGDGDNTGTGNVVLFSGSNTNTFSVTGLTAGVEYAVDIYEYNGTGVTASYNSTALNGTQYSMFAEPSTTFAAVTGTAGSATEIGVTWTDPSEAANNYVIVARLSTDATVAPDSGIEYSANTSFGMGESVGSGYVVYNGDGSAGSVTVTGLDQNETYEFDVFAFTGSASSDSTVFNYSNASDATGSEVTWLEASLTAIIEGPYDGTDMSSVNITVPSAQPYNTAPWNYAGAESNGSLPANVVDWVLVELRTGASASAASTVAFTQAALLLDDGSIVAADGVSPIEFELTGEADYYVAIHHRNHLAASSATALTDNGTSAFTYDFSTAGATGTDAVFDYNGDGSVYVLFGGWVDPTTDAVINSGDYSAVYSDRNNTTATYDYTDANMDGAVNAADRSMVFNNRDYSEQTP